MMGIEDGERDAHTQREREPAIVGLGKLKETQDERPRQQ